MCVCAGGDLEAVMGSFPHALETVLADADIRKVHGSLPPDAKRAVYKKMVPVKAHIGRGYVHVHTKRRQMANKTNPAAHSCMCMRV